VSEPQPYLAIVNPVAGGGRSRKLLGPALDRLRASGIAVELAETHGVGDATRIAREAYAKGINKIIAVGGDGTSYEVVNGLFPEAGAGKTPTLGFLPLGTGKFTGGTMMIAPKAEVNSGLIEYVRWGAIGRLGLIRNLPGLYDGTHIEHRLAERKAVRRVEFDLNEAVDVMVDGEVLSLHCEEIDVLPSALKVVA
jgi:diacylglycerol kinase family enzyme